MIAIFIGLTASNLLLLGAVFGIGLFVADGRGHPGALYEYHLGLGIAAGLMATLTHMAIYMYFMATTKWLGAAADKVGLDLAQFVQPAERRKRHAFSLVMTAIVMTMLTMFAGAGADPPRGALWPAEVHLVLAAVTVAVHLAVAAGEYRLITRQGTLMDQGLAAVNRSPNLSV